jgi:predicted nucleotidyltransferase
LLSSSPPYADKLNEFFYEGLGRQTSVCLYGSAATGNWVPGRSDLDLIILVPEEKLELLGQKIREWAWASTPKYPILDGYALSVSRSGRLVKRLDEFVKVTYPSDATIDLVDQWSIKNRSKHLFGNDSISTLFPDISHSQLRAWAFERLKYMLAGNPEGIVPEPKVVLSKLIWSVSWSARMLMLLRGNVCESKREALQWLASEYVEIRNLVCLLLDDYSKSDEVALSITSEQSAILRKFCLGQLRQESKSLGTAEY